MTKREELQEDQALDYKTYAKSLEAKGWLPPSNDAEARKKWFDARMSGGIVQPHVL